jgi:hypothetical protein
MLETMLEENYKEAGKNMAHGKKIKEGRDADKANNKIK